MRKSVHTPDQKQFLRLLREARREAGLTQVELAARLDTLQCVISNFERGAKRLDLVELCQVVDAIGIPLADFIERFERAAGRKQLP